MASVNIVQPFKSFPSSQGRPLQAVLDMPGERITGLLAQALDGRGPALMPIPAGTPDTRVAELLAAMRPTSVQIGRASCRERV